MKYITIPQLAKMMGVSRVTVYRKVKSGEIKATKVGHDYIVDDKEIQRLLSQDITEADKRRIDKAVKKTVEEYGDVLKWLGKE